MRNDEILTVKEVADLLKTTRQQVRKMIANEELPAVKVGREWRVLKAGILWSFLKKICEGPYRIMQPYIFRINTSR